MRNLTFLSGFLLVGTMLAACGNGSSRTFNDSISQTETNGSTQAGSAGTSGSTAGTAGQTMAGASGAGVSGNGGSSGNAGSSNAGSGGTGTSGTSGAGGTGGQPPSWASCTAPGQCNLQINACCAPCGGVALSNYDGVNLQDNETHHTEVCPEPMSCPKCAFIPDPNHAAFCEQSICKAVDIKEHSVSDCQINKDCTLRYSGCCEACQEAPDQLIALNKQHVGEYTSQVCNPDNSACPDCIPAYPVGSTAVCNQTTHHCEVVQP
jgi:hypothetical protein